MASDVLVSCPSRLSYLILQQDFSCPKDEPTHQWVCYWQLTAHVLFVMTLQCSELPLPSANRLFNSSITLRLPSRRVDGRSDARSLGRHCPFQSDYRWLLVALQRDRYSSVADLVQLVDDPLDNPVNRAFAFHWERPKALVVVIPDDQNSR